MYAHPDIEAILSSFENSECFDCQSEDPKWASLNNGIFLCSKCAKIHLQYDQTITKICSLETYKFSDEEIVFFIKGGNLKFKIFLAEYGILPDSPFELKYFSKAGFYYRKYLENEVYKITKKQYIPGMYDKPNENEGKDILEIKYNPEAVTDESFMGKVGDITNKIGKEIGDMKIGDKISTAGNTVYDFAKTSGNYIAGKTQEAYNSEFVQNITKKTGEGISSFFQKAKTFFGGS